MNELEKEIKSRDTLAKKLVNKKQGWIPKKLGLPSKSQRSKEWLSKSKTEKAKALGRPFKKGFKKEAGNQVTNNRNENPIKVPKTTGVIAAKPGIQHSSGFTSGKVAGISHNTLVKLLSKYSPTKLSPSKVGKLSKEVKEIGERVVRDNPGFSKAQADAFHKRDLVKQLQIHRKGTLDSTIPGSVTNKTK